MAAYDARTPDEGADLVGTFVLRDTDLPQLRGPRPRRCRSSCTGGAGSARRPGRARARRLELRLAGMEIALRDLDDLAGNVRAGRGRDRRASRPSGRSSSSCPRRPDHGWLAAADERGGGRAAAEVPHRRARRRGVPRRPRCSPRWIDAALDRETPFKCTAGLHRAVRHTGDDGFEHHGFLNVLLATRRAFDGAGRRGAADAPVLPSRSREPPTCSTSMAAASDGSALAGAWRLVHARSAPARSAEPLGRPRRPG